MSMLTKQVENLRVMSEFMFGRGDMSLGCQLRDAADTIESLRERLTERETCQIEQDWDCDEYPQARWWRCRGCGERFLYERGFKPHYCPECGRQAGDVNHE